MMGAGVDSAETNLLIVEIVKVMMKVAETSSRSNYYPE